MKSYEIGRLRNLGVIAHGGAGKTSLVEACLFNSGVINRLGRVGDGNTVSDYLPEEIKHNVSISTSLIPCEWKEHKINWLDTPGYSDFFGEVKSALRVSEGALMVLCGVGGLEVQAEILWEYTDSLNLPKFVFVNKLDRENANFSRVLEQVKSFYSKSRVVAVQIPIGSEAGFKGVVDVITQQALIYDTNGSGKFKLEQVPDDLQTEAETAREALAEAVAEFDDNVLNKYLDGEALTVAELQACLRQAVAANMVVPVLCGSAYKNIAIQPVLDFAATYMPQPQAAGQDKAALIFKTLADPFVGKLSYFKVFGGTIKSDSVVYNSTLQKDEKIGQI
ncbi:MAG: GTP-binding protein, partial [Peptococcaceae bacterium]|nr:GTP-binding protein [Peptococcaceae bacterium]